jgi:hypothetical protein
VPEAQLLHYSDRLLEEQLQPQQIVNQIGHLERQWEEIDSAIERLRPTHSRLSHGAAA